MLRRESPHFSGADVLSDQVLAVHNVSRNGQGRW
jgi:hypothetical protein